MSDEDSLPEVLRNGMSDYLTASAKAILGAVPFAGSLLAELAGIAIPNQRLDRLAKFVVDFESRVAGIEESESRIKAKWEDDAFLEMAEEAIRQAARSTSDDRRAYLATFLVNVMTNEQRQMEERRHLLRILGELTDVEIIWLQSFAGRRIGRQTEFYKLHDKILAPARNYMGAPQEERDRATMQASYKTHLAELGLLNKYLRLDRNGVPELEINKKEFKHDYSLSNLGYMLLSEIGFLPNDADESPA